jgi:hypothetical protein
MVVSHGVSVMYSATRASSVTIYHLQNEQPFFGTNWRREAPRELEPSENPDIRADFHFSAADLPTKTFESRKGTQKHKKDRSERAITENDDESESHRFYGDDQRMLIR